jgi:hypothetical protein
MWKVGWFLRDFLDDPELLSQDEVDERALRGLVEVVKISHTVINGISLVNFDAFAPASQWEDCSLNAWVGQVPWLLPGNDLCGLPSRGLDRRQQSGDPAAIHLSLLQVPTEPSTGGFSI